MESNYQTTNVPTSQDNQQTVPTSINHSNPLKRNFKLEFPSMDAGSAKNAKRPKLKLPSASSLNLNIPVLQTPDLFKVTMPTPELDKYMLTPGTPSQVLFSTNVDEEQEHYARSFVDNINDLKNNSNISFQLKTEISEDMFDVRCSSNSSSATNATYTTLDSSNFPNMSGGYEFNSSDGCSSIHIKDESTSPPMSPIDMESQERIKLERKRQRNRVAASKCRKRKLERISRLEDKVRQLKGENTELASLASKLKQQVCTLKEQVMEHMQNGCQIILNSPF